MSFCGGGTGPFASLEERLAHIQWKKACNGRQIQGALRQSKALADRDAFVHLSHDQLSSDHQIDFLNHDRVVGIVQKELEAPLPVCSDFLEHLSLQHVQMETKRHVHKEKQLGHLGSIQRRLDDLEGIRERKRAFERRKQEIKEAR